MRRLEKKEHDETCAIPNFQILSNFNTALNKADDLMITQTLLIETQAFVWSYTITSQEHKRAVPPTHLRKADHMTRVRTTS